MNRQKNITNPGVKEREILNAAKLAFEEATGFCITIPEVEPAEKIHPDAVLQIDAPDVEPKKFRAEIKGFITKAYNWACCRADTPFWKARDTGYPA